MEDGCLGERKKAFCRDFFFLPAVVVVTRIWMSACTGQSVVTRKNHVIFSTNNFFSKTGFPLVFFFFEF